MEPSGTCPKCGRPLPEGQTHCPCCQPPPSPMDLALRIAFTAASAALGAIAGAVAAVLLCMGLASIAGDNNTLKELAGHGVMLLAPAGILVGGVAGGIVGWRRSRVPRTPD